MPKNHGSFASGHGLGCTSGSMMGRVTGSCHRPSGGTLSREPCGFEFQDKIHFILGLGPRHRQETRADDSAAPESTTGLGLRGPACCSCCFLSGAAGRTLGLWNGAGSGSAVAFICQHNQLPAPRGPGAHCLLRMSSGNRDSQCLAGTGNVL